MSLAQNITMLLRPHPHTRADGRIIGRAALLDQVAESQMAQRQGGAGSNETRLPINTAAIELWKDLDDHARQAEQARANTMCGTLGAIIERWEKEKRTEWQDYLEQVTAHMIGQIETMFDPPPRRRALHQPCPACGQEWAHAGEEGERESSLTAGTHQQDGTMRPPSEYDVACGNCGAQWHGGELAWLLNALDTEEDKAA